MNTDRNHDNKNIDRRLSFLRELQADSRLAFGLPTKPAEDSAGVQCVLCSNECRIGEDDEIVLGFDGSFANDCTALVAVTIPKDGETSKIVPVALWEKDMVNDGPEWRVDIADVDATIVKFFQEHPKTREIVCDPFRWQRSIEVLAEKGLPMVEYYSSSPRRMVPARPRW